MPDVSSGILPWSFLSTGAVKSDVIKVGRGNLRSLSFFSKSAAAVYVRLYDMATAPATTDTPVWRGIVPGAATGAGMIKNWPGEGLGFNVGIGIRVTAAVADNDATALNANEIAGNAAYQ